MQEVSEDDRRDITNSGGAVLLSPAPPDEKTGTSREKVERLEILNIRQSTETQRVVIVFRMSGKVDTYLRLVTSV